MEGYIRNITGSVTPGSVSNEWKAENVKPQDLTLAGSWGGRRTRPYVFTEQGIAMLSSVLSSDRAIEVNIQIMRAFVKLREMISTHKDLAKKLSALEKKYNGQFQIVFEAIRQLIEVEESPKRKIGFIKESRADYRTSGMLRMSGRKT